MLRCSRQGILADWRRSRILPIGRSYTSTSRRLQNVPGDNNGHINVAELLSKPTWSVASLLPANDGETSTPEVTSKQLHHLLRLSALPPPESSEAEARLLSTLSSQLHFVKEIQKVDTAGVEPLRSLRDETAKGEQEAEIGLDALQSALDMEEVRGKHGRIKRRKERSAVTNADTDAQWDVLGHAGRKTGRYFVVEGGAKGD
jgi:Asp-tRNA(Asn)/Glu-tRNA(Gln) amidotransferase C subunit